MTNYLWYSPTLKPEQNRVASLQTNVSPQIASSNNVNSTTAPDNFTLSTPQFGATAYYSQQQQQQQQQGHSQQTQVQQQDVPDLFASPGLTGVMNFDQLYMPPFPGHQVHYASPQFGLHQAGAYSPYFQAHASPMLLNSGYPGGNTTELQRDSFDLPDSRHGGRGHDTSSYGVSQQRSYAQQADSGDNTSRVAHFNQQYGNTLRASEQQTYSKSPILDDMNRNVQHNQRGHFEGNNTKVHTLKEIVQQGMVAELATDQNGSRFIQTKLEDCSPEDKQAIFSQILPETLRLCTDVFGNYCIQKFFEHGTPEQKQALAEKIKNKVLPLSLQMYGCRVVQKILESVTIETQKALIHELEGHVLECVKDQNANHVIQKCIESINNKNIDFIIKSFYGRVCELSTHPYGCRVIQRMLEHCDPNLKKPVLDELLKSAAQLAKDQYGNYVLQHVLNHSSESHKDPIVDAVCKNILAFSKHKFASNVVERCFVQGETKQKDRLLSACIGEESSPLVSMVRDQYGNYVIQKMLETLNVTQRTKLIKKIQDLVPNIRKIAFGKHIVAKIEKLTGKHTF
eukprot:UN22834